VDEGLHHLQRKTERVKPAELVAFLQEFYRDKQALRNRHEAGAQCVATYEYNNAIQYVLAREDMHLAWLRAAIEALGGTVPSSGEASPPLPGGTGEARERAVLEDHVRQMQMFVERWRPRLGELTHARHRRLLDLILGETLEHRRLFEQALAGRTDLLGRRASVPEATGRVLPTRWVE
jgi:hypothetical protein